MPDPDYTGLLDRIDGHLRALRTTTYELTALSDLKDDIVTLTDLLVDVRLAAKGWEREARRLRERWCGNRWSGEWCALSRNEEPDPAGGGYPTVCTRVVRWSRPDGTEPLSFAHREPSCPDCREVLCLDPK